MSGEEPADELVVRETFKGKIAVEKLLPTKYLAQIHGRSKRIESLASSRRFFKGYEVL